MLWSLYESTVFRRFKRDLYLRFYLAGLFVAVAIAVGLAAMYYIPAERAYVARLCLVAARAGKGSDGSDVL